MTLLMIIFIFAMGFAYFYETKKVKHFLFIYFVTVIPSTALFRNSIISLKE